MFISLDHIFQYNQKGVPVKDIPCRVSIRSNLQGQGALCMATEVTDPAKDPDDYLCVAIRESNPQPFN